MRRGWLYISVIQQTNRKCGAYVIPSEGILVLETVKPLFRFKGEGYGRFDR